MHIRSYPKVYNLGHAGISDLFRDPVTVQEKVDGSQFSFCVVDGELSCRSKNKDIVIDAPDGMFEKAVRTAVELAPDLTDGWVYRGEYLNRPKHNHLKYDRVPKGYIMLFDISPALEAYLPHAQLAEEAARIGLETAPLIGVMKVDGMADVEDLLNRDSALGGTKVEGLVFKNYTRFGRDGKVLMGKLVSPEFRETQRASWKKSNPSGKDIVTSLGERLRSEARWRKAVMHLREDGELENSPRDIGKLMKAVPQDVKEECEEEIKDALFKWAWPNIKRKVAAGLPEWYKLRLVEKQFGEPDE